MHTHLSRSIRFFLAACLLAPLPAFAADTVEPGSELFAEYCAQCHGADGRGDGERTEFRDVVLTDLRTLAQRSGGALPLAELVRVIDGRAELESHGERFMPAWGEVFGFDETRGNALARARILNLILYLDSIQDK